MPHPSFAAGETLPASKLRALAVRDSYTPELTASTTDPDLGTFGTIEGEFYITGSLVTVRISIQFGSGASAGSGQYRVSLPPDYPLDPMYLDTSNPLIGWVRLRDDSAPSEDTWAPYTQSDGLLSIRQESSPNTTQVSASTPWTWAADDRIVGMFAYITEET